MNMLVESCGTWCTMGRRNQKMPDMYHASVEYGSEKVRIANNTRITQEILSLNSFI